MNNKLFTVNSAINTTVDLSLTFLLSSDLMDINKILDKLPIMCLVSNGRCWFYSVDNSTGKTSLSGFLSHGHKT